MREHELERDTRLVAAGESRFTGRVSENWGIYGNPQGGYLAVMMARALARSLPHPDPFTVTTHYLSSPHPGDVEIRVEVLRAGRSHSTGLARLIQDGKERVHTTAVFGDLGAIEGPTREVRRLPPIPSLEECEVRVGPPSGSSFTDRVQCRYVPGTTGFLDGQTGARMELGAHMRFTDGREPDALSLLLFADALPPPVLNAVEQRAWVPTLELTVHIRRRPNPGWLRGWFATRFLIDGYLDEDGELWDEHGQLVAISRQLARVQRA